MTEPRRGNAEIRRNQRAFMEAYERAREEMGRLDGVIGVGFGQKQRAGRFTPDVSITVFVREKKSEQALAPEQRIPSSFEGYRTDVQTPLRLALGRCNNDTWYPRIQGGIQITSGGRTNATNLYGTLGCIVRKRGDA